MNSSNPLENSLRFRESDRIPFDLGATTVSSITRTAYVRSMEFKGYPTDYLPIDEFDPIQQIVQPTPENARRLEIDTCRIGPPRLPLSRPAPSKEVPGRLEVTDQFGCDWIFDEGKDHYFNMISSPLKEFEQISDGLAAYRFPAFKDEAEAVFAHIESQFGSASDFSSEGGIVLDRNCAGITEVAFRIRGYEQFFMDLALDPSGAVALMEKILEYKLDYWNQIGGFLKEKGWESRVAVAVECDDLGTQTSLLFSPQMMRELVMPLQRRLIAQVKESIPGVKLFYHSDGAIFELIPDLIEMGVDILNPVQFTASGMDPASLKKEFGSELVFWGGGVDTQNTLPHGSPAEVRDEVQRNIELLAPGGGFVFAAVHNIQADVPPENFWAMWETLKSYS